MTGPTAPAQTSAPARQPNLRLRRIRLLTPSPSGSGLPMSRQELADTLNAWLYHNRGMVVVMDGRYIGRLERGRNHWPSAHCRAALRAVLGVETDAELGLYFPGRRPGDEVFIASDPILSAYAQRLGSSDAR